MKKKNLLWISLCAPYNSVKHAGGKNHNYYIKKVASDDRFDITLVTIVKPEEVNIVI